MDDLRYDGRVAIVTGGGRGLGRAYCEMLGKAGAKVVVNDLGVTMSGDEPTSEQPADEVARVIREAGGEAIANTDTVATEEGGKAIVQAALDAFGKVDILIHNAGNVRRSPLEEMTHETFKSVIDVHLMGGFNVLRPAFAAMKDNGYGRIVLTTSIGGLYGNYLVSPYCAAKAGLIGLSNNAALEGVPYGIKSNCIAPSAVTRMSEGVDTSQFPPLGPEFVAPAVAYLCHESCEFSGEIMAALGGRVAKVFVSETRGAARDSWTPAEVGAAMAEIDDRTDALSFPVVPTEEGGPHGFLKHLGTSFEMVK